MGRRALVFAAACAVCSAGSHVRADAPASGGEPAVRAYEEFCVTCHQMKFPVEKPRSCDEWKKTVARMSLHREQLKREAIPEASQDLIAQYLTDQSPGP